MVPMGWPMTDLDELAQKREQLLSQLEAAVDAGDAQAVFRIAMEIRPIESAAQWLAQHKVVPDD